MYNTLLLPSPLGPNSGDILVAFACLLYITHLIIMHMEIKQ
mgnify:CR=1 FL=1